MRILLRCDGGGSLGVGHVMRSLALAEAAVVAGHEVVVAGHFEGPFLQGQLAAAPVETVDLEPVPEMISGQHFHAQGDPLLELIGRFDPDVIHVDAYDSSWWLMGSRIRVNSNVEDGPFGRRQADVVIDPTFGAGLTPRPDDGSTWLLRGSRYTPVRERALAARREVGTVDTIDRSDARSVLVVMGGTDPVGLAPAAVGLLARTGLALDVTVIAVEENAARAREATAGSRLTLNILAPLDDLAALMARQDLVVSAAGTSVWELCCIGVPMALVWAVDNQRDGYDRMVAAGAALGLGGPDLGGDVLGGDHSAVDRLRTALTDFRVRADLAAAARKIVDGLGSWRVVQMWEQALALGPPTPVADAGLIARPATAEDARLLWEWRNDPETRAGTRHPDPVLWLDHLAWLNLSLTRDDRLLLVVEDDLGPVGTVRWDLQPDSDLPEFAEPSEPPEVAELERQLEWEVSITVAPESRGQSLSRPLLRAAQAALSERERVRGREVAAYLAMVHVDNTASLRLFHAECYLPDLPPDGAGFMQFRKAARVA